MPVGLHAFKDDGTLLFDIDRISYGLLKSGYLNLVDRWGRYYLKSAQLPPNEEGSYEYRELLDPICGISISDGVSPIVFLVGDGKPCGESLNGNVRTLYFQGCKPNTKAFVFDLMRDVGERTGMECYDANGRLSFTTGMPPLNIIAAVNPPAISAPVVANSDQRWTPYVGGANEASGREWSSGDFPQVKGAAYVPVVAGELAAYLTFSRSAGVTHGRDFNGINKLSANEGCGGSSGGVRFFFSPSASSLSTIFTNNDTIWFDIPTDRQPQALVIRASDYPFPFR
nr:hypothetical protein [uncultured Pseudomonas sp.]